MKEINVPYAPPAESPEVIHKCLSETVGRLVDGITADASAGGIDAGRELEAVEPFMVIVSAAIAGRKDADGAAVLWD